MKYSGSPKKQSRKIRNADKENGKLKNLMKEPVNSIEILKEMKHFDESGIDEKEASYFVVVRDIQSYGKELSWEKWGVVAQ